MAAPKKSPKTEKGQTTDSQADNQKKATEKEVPKTEELPFDDKPRERSDRELKVLHVVKDDDDEKKRKDRERKRRERARSKEEEKRAKKESNQFWRTAAHAVNFGALVCVDVVLRRMDMTLAIDSMTEKQWSSIDNALGEYLQERIGDVEVPSYFKVAFSYGKLTMTRLRNLSSHERARDWREQGKRYARSGRVVDAEWEETS